MNVFRITLNKWAGSLIASGRAARWNGNGHWMIYTASTSALACLENVVHRRSLGNDDLFKVMVINIPDHLQIDDILLSNLPPNWKGFTEYTICQDLGNEWLNGGTSVVLRVPSSIIPEEYNYLINPQHPDFTAITIIAKEAFTFDERLMDPGKR
jgi:RES domain-containing protein